MPQFPFLVIITSVLFQFDSQLSSVSYIYFFFLLCDSVHLCLVSSQLCLIPISPQRARALSTIVPLFTVSLSVNVSLCVPSYCPMLFWIFVPSALTLIKVSFLFFSLSLESHVWVIFLQPFTPSCVFVIRKFSRKYPYNSDGMHFSKE